MIKEKRIKFFSGKITVHGSSISRELFSDMWSIVNGHWSPIEGIRSPSEQLSELKEYEKSVVIFNIINITFLMSH